MWVGKWIQEGENRIFSFAGEDHDKFKQYLRLSQPEVFRMAELYEAGSAKRKAKKSLTDSLNKKN